MTTHRGVVIAIADPDQQCVLLLHRALHWSGWELVKGGTEEGESEAAAAEREVSEETGLTLVRLQPTDRTIRYPLTDDAEREDVCFLAIASGTTVRVSAEHDAHQWVTPAEARNILTHKDLLPLLDDLQHFLAPTS